jgi:hypothetical protein
MNDSLHQDPAPVRSLLATTPARQPAHRHPRPRPLAAALLAAVLLAVALLAAGCANEPEVAEPEMATFDAAELSPEELGRIGARLSQEPGRAEAILAEGGVTWEGFEAAVREAAASVETARRYAEAYRAAGGGGDATAPAASEPAGG